MATLKPKISIGQDLLDKVKNAVPDFGVSNEEALQYIEFAVQDFTANLTLDPVFDSVFGNSAHIKDYFQQFLMKGSKMKRRSQFVSEDSRFTNSREQEDRDQLYGLVSSWYNEDEQVNYVDTFISNMDERDQEELFEAMYTGPLDYLRPGHAYQFIMDEILSMPEDPLSTLIHMIMPYEQVQTELDVMLDAAEDADVLI